MIPGFSTLKREDRHSIRDKFRASRKRKREASEGTGTKKAKQEETKDDKEMKEQGRYLWHIRDSVSRDVPAKMVKLLLQRNGQRVTSGGAELIDRLADCMAFGALLPCPECKEGQLIFSGDGYRCTGNMTEWTKCMYITKTPTKTAFRVPIECHKIDFLKKFKYKGYQRLFPKATASASAGSDSPKPLNGRKFVIAGKTTKSKDELTEAIRKLGGEVVKKIDPTVSAVISTKETVAEGGKEMEKAEEADTFVVSEDFLEAVAKGKCTQLLEQFNICTWGSDPHLRLDEMSGESDAWGRYLSQSERADLRKARAGKEKSKVTVKKGGIAVDPDSGLEAETHVLEWDDGPLNAVLGQVDIVKGTNSYYKIQVLESDKETDRRWWLFSSWGRVGTSIGDHKLTEEDEAARYVVHMFKSLYKDKTGNAWEDRKNFVKYPNKFYPLDIDYGGEDVDMKALDKSDDLGKTSKLPPQVQELMKMIFDVEAMNAVLMEFQIDIKKMPLGKLSKNQIQQAYKVLMEINNLIESAASASTFLDASNRFYTLIPHDFGIKKAPIIDNAEILKQKTDLLENLLDIEVAYNMLDTEGTEDALDQHYAKLKTKIQPLDRGDREFQIIQKYVTNTHAKTHNHYYMNVEEVFRIDREGERKLFKPYKELGNRKLLWHGSGVTNFAGILSQGLRIAPPEAPMTGYMFGKGVYFADMVSKSANYCRTSESNPVGLLLLCDVALGNMYELTESEYVDRLPEGKHSTKGCGKTAPNPKESYETKSGLEIPLGKGVDTNVKCSSLLYNEYIVYNTAQINMKYLLKVKCLF